MQPTCLNLFKHFSRLAGKIKRGHVINHAHAYLERQLPHREIQWNQLKDRHHDISDKSPGWLFEMVLSEMIILANGSYGQLTTVFFSFSHMVVKARVWKQEQPLPLPASLFSFQLMLPLPALTDNQLPMRPLAFHLLEMASEPTDTGRPWTLTFGQSATALISKSTDVVFFGRFRPASIWPKHRRPWLVQIWSDQQS